MASRIIEYKIAMLIWLALSSSLGAAMVGNAVFLLQDEQDRASEGECVLADIAEMTQMSESFIDVPAGEVGTG